MKKHIPLTTTPILRRSPRLLRTQILPQTPPNLSLRRSPRFSHLTQQTPPSSPTKCRSESTLSEKPTGPRKANSTTGPRKSWCSSENRRRSLRISRQCGEISVSECNPIEELRNPRFSIRVRCDEANGDRKLGIAKGEARVAAVEMRKRKIEECEESKVTVRDWSEEQEMALQRAYLLAKPTPNFWKKVSRLVPGKSAQDCFDKLNSEYTPAQRGPVSRAHKKNVSPIPHFQLSASKVLKPNVPKSKKPSCNRQTHHAVHKNARLLLKEHYRRSQVHEGDLFSVLEPNSDLSTEPYMPSTTFSTPEKSHKTSQELVWKFDKRSISGGKKPLSRFSASRGKALASPAVLKQVNNQVMHERYIDQLHCRDAKRKIASKQSGKTSLKTADGKENQIPKLDVVRAAKNALVSDARDAIIALQQIRAYSASNSSDLDEDFFEGDADESEIDV